MSVKRMSFNETPDYLNAIGFQNRLSLSYRSEPVGNYIIIKKGSLLFGFKEDNTNDAYGFLINNDVELLISSSPGIYYLTCDKEGVFSIDIGNFNNVRGIGANISGIPWYTFNGSALVAKIMQPIGVISAFIICDDAYWCEYEGNQ